MRLNANKRTGLLSAILAVTLAISCRATAQQLDPRAAVKAAVDNELRSTERQSDFWMYRLNKETKSGTQVKDIVETKDGLVARLIGVNGRPLTQSERVADDERLTALANNPEEQRRKLQDQKTDEKKTLSLLQALPDALIYESDGKELMDGRETLRLKFKPNPAFHTTTRETIIFRASEGMLWIDVPEQRILRLDATLARDINIGWGIVGHIDKGGRVFLEQQRVGQGSWRIHIITVDATGQAFFFKSITLKQRQFAANYRPVPPGLSIADAVNLLKQQETTVAEEKPR